MGRGEDGPYLKNLEQLEVLNLSHSFLNDAGLINLGALPGLRSVYLLDTEVDTNVTNAMRQHLPKVKLLNEEGPYY